MIRTYTCGRTVEKTKFPVGSRTQAHRARRIKGNTSTHKQAGNDRAAVKRLARSINCNFGYGDYWLTLKYDETMLAELVEGTDGSREQILSAAKDQRHKLLQKVARRMKKAGVEFKFIAATADVDGNTLEPVRVHHHIIVNGDAVPFVKAAWNDCCVRTDPLKNQPDYTPIAVYICNQSGLQPDARKYTSSSNLKKPVITETVADYDIPVRTPRGSVIMENHTGALVPYQYVRFIKPDTKGKRKSGSGGADGI